MTVDWIPQLEIKDTTSDCDHNNIWDPCFRPYIIRKYTYGKAPSDWTVWEWPAWPMKGSRAYNRMHHPEGKGHTCAHCRAPIGQRHCFTCPYFAPHDPIVVSPQTHREINA